MAGNCAYKMKGGKKGKGMKGMSSQKPPYLGDAKKGKKGY